MRVREYELSSSCDRRATISYSVGHICRCDSTESNAISCCALSETASSLTNPPPFPRCASSSVRPLHDLSFLQGLFTSPHLLEVTERVRLDGKPLAKNTFARYFFQVWDRLQTTAAQAASPPGCDINGVHTSGVKIADMPGYFHLLTLVRV